MLAQVVSPFAHDRSERTASLLGIGGHLRSELRCCAPVCGVGQRTLSIVYEMVNRRQTQVEHFLTGRLATLATV